MKTTYCTELRTYGQTVKDAIPTGDGRFTTVEDVMAFFASVEDDFFPRGKTQKLEHPDLMAA